MRPARPRCWVRVVGVAGGVSGIGWARARRRKVEMMRRWGFLGFIFLVFLVFGERDGGGGGLKL